MSKRSTPQEANRSTEISSFSVQNRVEEQCEQQKRAVKRYQSELKEMKVKIEAAKAKDPTMLFLVERELKDRLKAKEYELHALENAKTKSSLQYDFKTSREDIIQAIKECLNLAK